MNFILSIQLGHNSTICIADDQKIIGSLSQEKVDNIKNSSSFPSEAIKVLLKNLNIELSYISKIVICGNQIYPPNPYNYKLKNNKLIDKNIFIFLTKYLLKLLKLNLILQFLKKIRQENLNKKGRKFLQNQLKLLGLDKKPLSFVNHHDCHMAAALFSNRNFKVENEYIILTIDGAGDGESSTINIYRDGAIKKISSTNQITSIGNFYSGVTRFLGMKPLEHEYKVMGLAPYANQKYSDEIYEKFFHNLITIDPISKNKFLSEIDCFETYDYLCKNCIGYRFDNIAAAAQKLTEELVLALIQNLLKKYQIKNFCFGGGVFMNVKLNMKIQKMKELENVYFMPSSGDESNPIGAIYYENFYKNKKILPYLNDLYLGLKFQTSEILQFINANSDALKLIKVDNFNEFIAQKLSEDKIIARFSGRGEFGARSLGNRAILANPSNLQNFYRINNLVKSRDFWMPFAPTILKEFAHLYIKDFDQIISNTDSMITAFEATEKGRIDLISAVHPSDYTLRPQVLEESQNKDYYDLIKWFYKITGVPSLLNTSFNLHGYPMVSTLDQALFAFKNSKLDYLIIENFVVSKK